MNDKFATLDHVMIDDLVAQGVVKHEQVGTMRVDHEALALQSGLALDETQFLVGDELVAHVAHARARPHRIEPRVERQLGSMLLDLAYLARQQLLERERIGPNAVLGQLGRQIGLLLVDRVLDLRDELVAVVELGRWREQALAQLELALHVVE